MSNYTILAPHFTAYIHSIIRTSYTELFLAGVRRTFERGSTTLFSTDIPMETSEAPSGRGQGTIKEKSFFSIIKIVVTPKKKIILKKKKNPKLSYLLNYLGNYDMKF